MTALFNARYNLSHWVTWVGIMYGIRPIIISVDDCVYVPGPCDAEFQRKYHITE